LEAREILLPGFTVVGYKIEANLDEIEAGLGKQTYDALISSKDEIANQTNGNVILIQIYPMKPGFHPRVDRFTQIFGYEVASADRVPAEMIQYTVPESKYVTYTHQGLESELGITYDYLYGKWIRETGNEPRGYDFEIWDDRYKPDSPSNEIDVFVALK